MYNILDYISWRGDLSFAISPFNDVDNLVLTELAYAAMEEITPGVDSDEEITLKEFASRYKNMKYDQSYMINNPAPLIESSGKSRRFRDIKLKYYVNEINKEKNVQFSAVTFILDRNSCYVAFRGTDNSLTGWREDFVLSYADQSNGQNKAVEYLNYVGKKLNMNMLVGGHSKGGNFAVYSGAFCDKSVSERIKRIYSNDGPGFNQNIIEKQGYKEILPKVKLIIPEDSIIGIIMSNTEKKHVVKSSARGIRQHNPYTWSVLSTKFEEAKGQSKSSLLMDEAIDRWAASMTCEQRENVICAVFDSLESTGADTFSELKSNKKVYYRKVIKALFALNDDTKKDIMTGAVNLAKTGKDVLWEEAHKSLNSLIKNKGR
ncbi:MAG: Mbeg1-like protein [Hornefia sp.]|nr:Mbeg1-like protein [Hornefia sp.]